MPTDNVIRAEMKAQGLRTKRNNLLAAALSGSILVFVSVKLFPYSISIMGVLAGLLIGFIYANSFEYCLHRFLLHSGQGIFAQQHMVHHTTLNSPEAARYVNFSRNPWGVVALFLVNALLFLFLQGILRNSWHNGWLGGVFVSFAVYYIAFEEIHWRTHMGGWLPKWLRPAARHHLLHHAHDTGRFNVFLPIFDKLTEWLLPQARISHDRAER